MDVKSPGNEASGARHSQSGAEWHQIPSGSRGEQWGRTNRSFQSLPLQANESIEQPCMKRYLDSRGSRQRLEKEPQSASPGRSRRFRVTGPCSISPTSEGEVWSRVVGRKVKYILSLHVMALVCFFFFTLPPHWKVRSTIIWMFWKKHIEINGPIGVWAAACVCRTLNFRVQVSHKTSAVLFCFFVFCVFLAHSLSVSDWSCVCVFFFFFQNL